MNALQRARNGVRTVIGDPVGRRAYVGRLKWLLRGSGDLHAHSLEYRAGLTGRWAIPAKRSNPNDEIVFHCPPDCSINAPLSHLYEHRFVYRLKHTVASTASGATVMCGSKEPPFFIRESITWPFESILSHGLEVPESKQATKTMTGTSIVFPTTTNYYHWLIEDLPTVLRAVQVAPDASVFSFTHGITDRHSIISQALQFNLIPAPLIVAMDEQVLAGRASDSWFVHPDDAQMLYDLGKQLTGISDIEAGDKIYISRRGTARPLPNEDQLEESLANRGFTILRLEDMPWLDQIRAFQSAKTIVAPHGAGLANLVFTPPGATVMEITFGLHYNRCYEWLCHVREFDFKKIDSDAGVESTNSAILDAITATER